MRSQRRSRSVYSIAETVNFTEYDFFLAKHRGDTIFKEEIKIRCGPNFHKIMLRFPGNITLQNHDQAETRMLMKLGGDKPDCLTFLEQWRNGDWTGQTHRPLVTKLNIAKERAKSVRSSARNSGCDWMLLPIHDRLFKRIGQVYQLTLEKLGAAFQSTPSGSSRYRYNTSVDRPEDWHNEIMLPKMRLEFVDVRKGFVEVEEEVGKD